MQVRFSLLALDYKHFVSSTLLDLARREVRIWCPFLVVQRDGLDIPVTFY